MGNGALLSLRLGAGVLGGGVPPHKQTSICSNMHHSRQPRPTATTTTLHGGRLASIMCTVTQ